LSAALTAGLVMGLSYIDSVTVQKTFLVGLMIIWKPGMPKAFAEMLWQSY